MGTSLYWHTHKMTIKISILFFCSFYFCGSRFVHKNREKSEELFVFINQTHLSLLAIIAICMFTAFTEPNYHPCAYLPPLAHTFCIPTLMIATNHKRQLCHTDMAAWSRSELWNCLLCQILVIYYCNIASREWWVRPLECTVSGSGKNLK